MSTYFLPGKIYIKNMIPRKGYFCKVTTKYYTNYFVIKSKVYFMQNYEQQKSQLLRSRKMCH